MTRIQRFVCDILRLSDSYERSYHPSNSTMLTHWKLHKRNLSSMKPGLPPCPETQFLIRMLVYYNEPANTVLKIFCSSQHLGRSYQVFRVCFKLKINTSRLNAEDALDSTALRARGDGRSKASTTVHST